jgi:hypothetical protein
VLEDDGLSLALIDNGHAPTFDFDKPLLGIGLGGRGPGGMRHSRVSASWPALLALGRRFLTAAHLSAL